MIVIESKRKKPATILKKYPDAILADVTSGAKDGLVKLSPFYPPWCHSCAIQRGLYGNLRRSDMARSEGIRGQ